MSDPDTHPALWLAFLSMNEQATRDWLTGLHNRRYFEETLTDHIEAANRYERELSLVLFDIDNFKQINDTHGHEAGDDVLRQFANILKTTARKADIACRFGGDEFAVILPETNRASAERFAERVLCGTGILPVNHGQDAHATPISATAGVAALPSKNLMAEADANLLARKKESRR
ncbi:MAG: GGDEF domain-containing protein [Verrucomicrobiota bacterium]